MKRVESMKGTLMLSSRKKMMIKYDRGDVGFKRSYWLRRADPPTKVLACLPYCAQSFMGGSAESRQATGPSRPSANATGGIHMILNHACYLILDLCEQPICSWVLRLSCYQRWTSFLVSATFVYFLIASDPDQRSTWSAPGGEKQANLLIEQG